MHYIVHLDEKSIGCARWNDKDQTITIDRFCILPAFRNCGFGFVFIKYIFEDIKASKRNILAYSTAGSKAFFMPFGFAETNDILKVNY